MSIEALNWAFNLELPAPGQKLVLLTLANYADEHGRAFPSQKALSQKTCMSERAIRDNLVRLEELEIVKRIPRARSDGSFTTDLFELSVGAKPKILEEKSGDTPAADSAGSAAISAAGASGNFCQTQRQILPVPAADSAGHEPSLNTTITKNNLPARAQAREALKKLGVGETLAARWLLIREAKEQETNDSTLEIIRQESVLAGISFPQAIQCCCDHNWAWFKSSWYSALPEKSRPAATPDPQKASSASDWRDSADGVLKRGLELGIERTEGESEDSFKKRVIDAAWSESRRKAAEFVLQHKGKGDDKKPAAA